MNYFKNLYPVIESLLPGEKLVYAFQNTPREKPPFWMIQFITDAMLGSPSRAQSVDDEGIRKSHVVKSLNFRIQYFGKDAFWKVEEFRQQLSKETVLEAFYKQGFSIFNVGSTYLFYNDVDFGQVESFAAIDAFAYYSYIIDDKVEAIEKVIIDTDYNPEKEPKEYTIAEVIVNDKFGD